MAQMMRREEYYMKMESHMAHIHISLKEHIKLLLMEQTCNSVNLD